MSAIMAADPTIVRPFPKIDRVLNKSIVHRLALAAVWLTIASSAIVFSEPAPVDALTFGLMVLLPVIGLTSGKPMIWYGFAAWLIISACGLASASFARDTDVALGHMTVSFYLVGAWFLIAGFVAKRPEAHTRLILNALLVTGVIAATLGVIGYLNLLPGAFELFTKYDRAAGTFKDPNVFGPFLIAPLLTALHLWLTRPLSRGVLPLLAAAILAVGILFSFSRGAWAAAAIGIAVYSYLYMLTAERNWHRVKLAALVLGGALVIALIVAAALQSEAVARLLQERATLTQPYDEGPDGRFGGQLKAIGLLLENPFGIGSQVFTRFYHHEEVHNVYLSMFLNSGWIGGLLFFLLNFGTLVLGFRHALKNTKTTPLFLIAFAALAGNVIEGMLIDTDHWRHVYLLMAIVWGLMAADRRPVRKATIVRDRRHVLLRDVLLIPPSRRVPRLLAEAPRFILLQGVPMASRKRKRAPRILGVTATTH